MSQLAEQKCPACGAAMRFDPPTGKLVCDYCDTVVDIPATAQKTPQKPEEPKEPQEADIQGFDFSHLSDQAAREDAASLPVYNCVSCGAEVIAPAEQMALTCPYCGNNIVLTDKASGRLRPDGVIPFRIESAGLPDAVNRFYRDKKLLPRRFFSESTMGKVTGVYVPFWVFSGTLSGTLTYSGEKSSSTRKGDYVTVRTAHYRLNRGASLAYAELPVDASTKVDNKLMDSLEPFRTEEAKPFDMRKKRTRRPGQRPVCAAARTALYGRRPAPDMKASSAPAAHSGPTCRPNTCSSRSICSTSCTGIRPITSR